VHACGSTRLRRSRKGQSPLAAEDEGRKNKRVGRIIDPDGDVVARGERREARGEGIPTGCKVPARVGDALLGVEDREELEGVSGAGRKVAQSIGDRVRGDDARPGVARVVEALDPQPEARVVAVAGRLPVDDRRLAALHRDREVRRWIRG
jgi:hypothetical protein